MTSDNKPYYETAQAPDFLGARDPFALFDEWMRDAEAHEQNDPNAMAVASVDADGLPNLRMVLLKGVDARGFVFYTNLESDKGRELLSRPMAALVFHWKSLRRQVRARGPVEVVTDAEADAYFATRPKGSQIGAWASRQSRPLEGRFALEKAVAKMTARYGFGPVPRPPYWSGLRIVPLQFEFWHDRPFRLHDRLRFSRAALDEPWQSSALYP